MSQNRKKSLKLLPIQTECKITFVTPDNLHTYIKKDNPLHPAYDYLSEVHKSDYLRIYFMKFYGVGYHDIKQATGSWVDSFSSLKKVTSKSLDSLKASIAQINFLEDIGKN